VAGKLNHNPNLATSKIFTEKANEVDYANSKKNIDNKSSSMLN
jgi:hypothetical protein